MSHSILLRHEARHMLQAQSTLPIMSLAPPSHGILPQARKYMEEDDGTLSDSINAMLTLTHPLGASEPTSLPEESDHAFDSVR